MATTKTTTRRTTERTKRGAGGARPPITAWFKNWLEVKDEAAQLGERQSDLRVRLIDSVAEFGEEDDKGNAYYDLAQPVTFTDHKGKVFKYTSLKRERHLIPASPVPDPEKAEELLREKRLWLTKAQEKAIRDLQVAVPFARVTVEVDIDAVAAAYFKDIISEDEYTALLVEQKESFQFRPAES